MTEKQLVQMLNEAAERIESASAKVARLSDENTRLRESLTAVDNLLADTSQDHWTLKTATLDDLRKQVIAALTEAPDD